MSKRFLFTIVLPLLLLACHTVDPDAQKGFLSGYWQIKNVNSPYHEDKNYKINETIDYIEINGNSGFRAKVLPRIDGTIITNGNSENIELKTIDDSLRLQYKTAYDSWTETVLEANEETLKVKNDRGIIYTYARYELIDLKADGLLYKDETE